jgi:hypothetical protein
MNLFNLIKQTIVGGILAIAGFGVVGHPMVPTGSSGASRPSVPSIMTQQPTGSLPTPPGMPHISGLGDPVAQPGVQPLPAGVMTPFGPSAGAPVSTTSPQTTPQTGPKTIPTAIPTAVPSGAHLTAAPAAVGPVHVLTPTTPATVQHPTLPANGIGTVYVPPPPMPK